MQVPGAPGALAWCQVNTVTRFITSRQAADWEAAVFCWGAQVLFCQGKPFEESGCILLEQQGGHGRVASGREREFKEGLNCSRKQKILHVKVKQNYFPMCLWYDNNCMPEAGKVWVFS